MSAYVTCIDHCSTFEHRPSVTGRRRRCTMVEQTESAPDLTILHADSTLSDLPQQASRRSVATLPKETVQETMFRMRVMRQRDNERNRFRSNKSQGIDEDQESQRQVTLASTEASEFDAEEQYLRQVSLSTEASEFECLE